MLKVNVRGVVITIKKLDKIIKILKPFGLIHIGGGLFTYEDRGITFDLKDLHSPKDLIPLAFAQGKTRGRVELKTELQNLISIQNEEL